MGSRVVLPRSGVLMNNGVMWFDPTPGAPTPWRPASAR
jgi:gamma-glutamyltranspeptidase/glutathione hydrolase